jgi:hypothetical protein
MKAKLFVTTILLVYIGFIPQAKSQMSQEQKEQLQKLHPYLGAWKYEGEYIAGPLGPGGKVVGGEKFQMILGGFFMQGHFSEKGAMGNWEGLEIKGYDSVTHAFTNTIYNNDGSTFSEVFTVSGDTTIGTGKWISAGTQYLYRITIIFAEDKMSFMQKAENSADGKTWAPWWVEKWTKVKPAPKE